MRYWLLVLFIVGCTGDVTISPPQPTPTQEIACIPNSYGFVWEYTVLYIDPNLNTKQLEHYHEDLGFGHLHTIELLPYTRVLFIRRNTQYRSWEVTTVAPSDKHQGWIPSNVLSEECW